MIFVGSQGKYAWCFDNCPSFPTTTQTQSLGKSLSIETSFVNKNTLLINLPTNYPNNQFRPMINNVSNTYSMNVEVDMPSNLSISQVITCTCNSSNSNYLINCSNWSNGSSGNFQTILTISPNQSNSVDYNSIPISMVCYDNAVNSAYFGINSTIIYPIPDVVFNTKYILLPSSSTVNTNPSSTTLNPITNQILPMGAIGYSPNWIFGLPLTYNYNVLDYSVNSFSPYQFNIWVNN